MVGRASAPVGARNRASAPRARADSHEPHPRDVGIHAGRVDAEAATPRRIGRSLLRGRGRRLHVSPGFPALDDRASRRRRGLSDGDQHRRVERPPDPARSARRPRSPLLLPLFPHGRVPAAGVLHRAPGGPVARAGRPAAVHHQLVRRRRPGHERGAHVSAHVHDHGPRGAEPPRGVGLRVLHEPHGPSRAVHLPDGGPAPAHPVDGPPRAPGRSVARCRAARRHALGPDALRDLSDLRPRVPLGGLRGGVPPAAARRADAPPGPTRRRRPAPVRRGRCSVPVAVRGAQRRARPQARHRRGRVLRHGPLVPVRSRSLQRRLRPVAAPPGPPRGGACSPASSSSGSPSSPRDPSPPRRRPPPRGGSAGRSGSSPRPRDSA
jgi:hypothetical protein